jgi:hypothetical protein
MKTEVNQLGRAVVIGKYSASIFNGGSANDLLGIIHDRVLEDEIDCNYTSSGDKVLDDVSKGGDDIPYITGVMITEPYHTSLHHAIESMNDFMASPYNYSPNPETIIPDMYLNTCRGNLSKIKMGDLEAFNGSVEKNMLSLIETYCDEDDRHFVNLIFEVSLCRCSESSYQQAEKELDESGKDAWEDDAPSEFDDNRDWVVIGRTFMVVSFVFKD